MIGKLLKTLIFFKTHRDKAVTDREIKDFILTTWGKEIYSGLQKGTIELSNYLNFLDLSESDRAYWINRIQDFLKKVMQK